jgi:hypothetical protein
VSDAVQLLGEHECETSIGIRKTHQSRGHSKCCNS